MASTQSFPQVPNTVWRGVWGLLKRSPNRKLDEATLAIELNVQNTAARQYIVELNRLGILELDGAPTNLANKWRQDGDDPSIIQEILGIAYPDDLLQLAPPDKIDRAKITKWFGNQNLGEGAAKNKAATYIRVATGMSLPDAATDRAPRSSGGTSKKTTKKTDSKSTTGQSAKPLVSGEGQRGDPGVGNGSERRQPNLNVNVQIHISADASTEQIDAIFVAMRRYFDDSATS